MGTGPPFLLKCLSQYQDRKHNNKVMKAVFYNNNNDDCVDDDDNNKVMKAAILSRNLGSKPRG